MPGVEAEALRRLEAHAWPGNVRELENAIERAVTLAEGDTVDVNDLPEGVVQAGRTELLRDAVRSGSLGFEEAVTAFEQDLIRESLERHEWNQTRTAEQLGITRRLLKLKMDKYCIDR